MPEIKKSKHAAELEVLLSIVEKAANLMQAERATLFLHDAKDGTLYSRAITGEAVSEIRIPVDQGVAGQVFQSGDPQVINDMEGTGHYSKVDARTGFITRSMMCLPLNGKSGQRVGVIQVLNRHKGNFSAEDLPLLEAFASQSAMTIENARLCDHLAEATDRSTALADELDQVNRELQEAYRDLEARSGEVEGRLKRGKLIRNLVLASLGIALVVGAFFIMRSGLVNRMEESEDYVSEDLGQEAQVVVETVERSLTLRGSLAPLRMANVVAPFSGRISESYVNYGDSVTEGQLLLKIHPGQQQANLRNARIAEMRARAELEKLKGWDSSAEVVSAHRNVRQSERQLEIARRTHENNRVLFEKGIIASVTLEQMEAELESATANLSASTNQLASIIAQGGGENLKSAELQFENASDQLAAIEELLERAEVRAPADGVLLEPPRQDGQQGGMVIDVGALLQEGNLIFAIGNLSGFTVRTEVDELDVVKIKSDQLVEANCDAFPELNLRGQVKAVSSQAQIGGGGLPAFGVEVVIPELPGTARGRLQLGMSVNLSVVVYRNESALTVPVALVETDGMANYVWRIAESGQPERREIETGWTTVDRVEVKGGLVEGDRVVPQPTDDPGEMP